MSTTTQSNPKVFPSRRVLIIAVIALVLIALVAMSIWMMTDQTIAPPGLRIMAFFWKLFSWIRG